MFSKLSVQVYITALASKQNLIETRNSNIQILETKTNGLYGFVGHCL